MFRKHLTIVLFTSLLISCAEKDITTFEVTYEVNTPKDLPLKTFISYTDSTGRVTLYTTEKKWSKKATLHTNQIASLCATVSYDWDSVFVHYPGYYCFDEEQRQSLISGSIIHPQKTVTEYGEYAVLISLPNSETKTQNSFSIGYFVNSYFTFNSSISSFSRLILSSLYRFCSIFKAASCCRRSKSSTSLRILSTT